MKRKIKNNLKKLDTVVISFAFFLILVVVIATFSGGEITGNAAVDIVEEASENIQNPFSIVSEVLKKIDSEKYRKVKSGKNLTVHFIDVGHGDAILLQTPNNGNILIDAGYYNSKKNLSLYLKDNQVTYLDAVIATHPDEDHIGGMSWIIGKTKFVYYVIDNGQETNSTAYISYAKRLTKGKEHLSINKTQSIFLDEEMSFDALIAYTNESYLNGTNANSIVIRAKYGDVSFLFTGDCTIECENEIMKNWAVDADILKVGHHGDKDATSLEFLERVNPELAVITTGEEEKFGHPHEEVVERLKNNKVNVLRTDHNGTIKVITDGVSYWYETAR